ncbi:hypothetical protein EJB05_54963, partial [Eragrostis curvula]
MGALTPRHLAVVVTLGRRRVAVVASDPHDGRALGHHGGGARQCRARSLARVHRRASPYSAAAACIVALARGHGGAPASPSFGAIGTLRRQLQRRSEARAVRERAGEAERHMRIIKPFNGIDFLQWKEKV